MVVVRPFPTPWPANPWAGPGNEDVCEGFCCHEDRKDNPIHHPPNLWVRVQSSAQEPKPPGPAPGLPNPEIPQSQSHCIAGYSFPHLLRQEPLRNCLPFQCPPSMLRPRDPPWPLLIMAGLPSTRPLYLRSVPPSIEPLESDRPGPPASPSPTTSLTIPQCCRLPHSLHSHILECSCSSQPCRKHTQDTACQI